MKENMRRLVEWTQFNFSNRVLGKVCHFDDLRNNPKYEKHINENYDQIISELRENPYRPSPILATLATSECFSASEFLTIAKMSENASAKELKEFCELREQHAGGELRMIDYLCFPMIVKMTKHLPITDKINLIMTKPELLSDKIYINQSLKELMPTERFILMNRATPEQRGHLENELKKADKTSEIIHYNTTDIPNGYIWLVCVEAQNRYKNIKAGRSLNVQRVAHQNPAKPDNAEQRQHS